MPGVGACGGGVMLLAVGDEIGDSDRVEVEITEIRRDEES